MSEHINCNCPLDPRYDRNQFTQNNYYVGDIENGMRYPFGVLPEEESDKRYAVKETETKVSALEEKAAELEGIKADKSELAELSAEVDEKADKGQTDTEITDIKARLDALEYKGIEISSFTATPSMMELGSSNTVTLKWSLNKAATSQQIDGVMVTGNSKQYNNVTSDRSYTLSVTDGQTTKSKSVSVSFANQIYYGAAENLNNVTELDKVLSNTKTRTVTVDAGADQYIIYAVPVRLGGVRFFVNGFEGGFAEPEIMQLRNASNFTEPYNVYKSIRANLGVTAVEVKE